MFDALYESIIVNNANAPLFLAVVHVYSTMITNRHIKHLVAVRSPSLRIHLIEPINYVNRQLI